MVEKKEGNKMNCLNCGEELTCGWSKPSGGYAPKLQWQNPDKTAHFTRFDGSKYICPVEKEEIDTKGSIKRGQDGSMKGPVNQIPKPQQVEQLRSSEQKVIDAIQMVELLWCTALEKAKKVYKISLDTKEPHTNKDVMILGQVFFKAMTESYLK